MQSQWTTAKLYLQMRRRRRRRRRSDRRENRKCSESVKGQSLMFNPTYHALWIPNALCKQLYQNIMFRSPEASIRKKTGRMKTHHC
jgi:hypothetical protein